MKKLAICIPNYNRVELFRNLLQRLLFQIKDSEYKEIIEICISDDGSDIDITDEINSVISDNPDIRIKFYRFAKNTGLMNNLISSVEMSEAEYCWVIGNDDDLFGTSTLDTVIDTLSILKPDVLAFPICQRTNNIDTMVYPTKRNLESRLFEFSIEEDFKLWFNNIDEKERQGNILGMFIFISNLVFKKSNWDKHSHECDWDRNSLFHQAYIHLKTLMRGGVLYYYENPLVVQNANFYIHEVMCKRVLYSYSIMNDMCDYISYFFDGEMERRFLNQFCFYQYYGIVIDSEELNDDKKKRVKEINAEPIAVLNRIFLPTNELYRLNGKNVLLFGSGDYGNIAMEKFKANGIAPAYYIDNDCNKHGRFINGI